MLCPILYWNVNFIATNISWLNDCRPTKQTLQFHWGRKSLWRCRSHLGLGERWKIEFLRFSGNFFRITLFQCLCCSEANSWGLGLKWALTSPYQPLPHIVIIGRTKSFGHFPGLVPSESDGAVWNWREVPGGRNTGENVDGESKQIMQLL